MSIEISVSANTNSFNSIQGKYLTFPNNSQNLGCSHIIEAFLKNNLEGKFVPNISSINNQLELGCTITMPKEYKSKDKLDNIWNIIKYSLPKNSNYFNQNKYDCAHLKIDSEYQGCIYNYLKADFCPLKPLDT